jgi:hypothetical protein
MDRRKTDPIAAASMIVAITVVITWGTSERAAVL